VQNMIDFTPANTSAEQVSAARHADDLFNRLFLDAAVKGAYDEPARIAFRSRADVDASFQSLSLLIAGRAREGGARLVLATHDSALIERIASFGGAIGIPPGVFEVQMLYGIRAGELARLSSQGYPARTLIAYGDYWYPWYMRRLAERPANVAFALRQLLP